MRSVLKQLEKRSRGTTDKGTPIMSKDRALKQRGMLSEGIQDISSFRRSRQPRLIPFSTARAHPFARMSTEQALQLFELIPAERILEVFARQKLYPSLCEQEARGTTL